MKATVLNILGAFLMIFATTNISLAGGGNSTQVALIQRKGDKYPNKRNSIC